MSFDYSDPPLADLARRNGIRVGVEALAATALSMNTGRSLPEAARRLALGTYPACDVEAAERVLDFLNLHGFEVTVNRTAPTWQIGDVVVLRFPGNSTPYTYGFDGSQFPGRTRAVSAEAMTQAWKEGRAKLLVRDGEHFDDPGPGARLPVLPTGRVLVIAASQRDGEVYRQNRGLPRTRVTLASPRSARSIDGGRFDEVVFVEGWQVGNTASACRAVEAAARRCAAKSGAPIRYGASL